MTEVSFLEQLNGISIGIADGASFIKAEECYMTEVSQFFGAMNIRSD